MMRPDEELLMSSQGVNCWLTGRWHVQMAGEEPETLVETKFCNGMSFHGGRGLCHNLPHGKPPTAPQSVGLLQPLSSKVRLVHGPGLSLASNRRLDSANRKLGCGTTCANCKAVFVIIRQVVSLLTHVPSAFISNKNPALPLFVWLKPSLPKKQCNTAIVFDPAWSICARSISSYQVSFRSE